MYLNVFLNYSRARYIDEESDFRVSTIPFEYIRINLIGQHFI